MIVNVVMSNDTRTPALSLCLGTVFRIPTKYLGPDDALTMTDGVGRERWRSCELIALTVCRARRHSHRSSSSCFNTSPII